MNFPAHYSVLLLSVLLFGTFIQPNNSQASISVDTSSPYQCGKDLKLRCSYSGSGSCCAGLRLWSKNGSLIMNNGAEISTTGKYTEETFDSNNYFILSVKDLSASEFGVSFICSYAGDDSTPITLKTKDFFCPPCWGCGGICFGYSLIGVIIAVAIGAVIVKITGKLQEQFVKITLISGGTGLVVDVIVTLFTGAYSCLCELGFGPACIVIGLPVGLLVVLVVLLVFYNVPENGKLPKGSGGADSSGSRPPQGVRRPEIRESAQAGAHTRTENSSPKKNEYASKLDSVPKGRPLPQIGGNSPRELPQLDQGKNNITKLDPLVVFEDPGEKKKKKKKRKKQQENDEVET